MKNSLTIVIGIVIVVVLIAYMFAFQVRYDEVALLTTFGSADKSDIKDKPGLKFRLPRPIQSVHRYSTRVQILEDEKVEVPTADGRQVVIQAYLAWRITHPLAFFRQLTDINSAQEQLKSLLRSYLSPMVSQYNFDQLVNIRPENIKLGEIERGAAEQLQRRIDDYGIKVEQIGLRRILLPEGVTALVFERMKATRMRMAAGARASGKGEAEGIRSEAESARERILAFAQRHAQSQRAEGDKEAASYYKTFDKNPELAILLRRLKTIKTSLKSKTTFVLPAEQLQLNMQEQTDVLKQKWSSKH